MLLSLPNELLSLLPPLIHDPTSLKSLTLTCRRLHAIFYSHYITAANHLRDSYPYYICTNDDGSHFPFPGENAFNSTVSSAEYKRWGILSRTLCVAISAGHEHTVRTLVKHGASVNMDPENSWYAPLLYAVEAAGKSGVGMVPLLLELGASPEQSSQVFYRLDGTPLGKAVENGNVEVVKLLLAAGAEVDGLVDEGRLYTPLLIAAVGSETGHAEVVRLLVECGADVEARSSDGKSPIIRACRNLESTRVLLDAGADAERAGDDGMTALIEGAWYLRWIEEMKLYNEVTTKKMRYEEMAEVFRLVIKAGCPIDAKDEHGNTALHYAAKWGVGNCVGILRHEGADPTIKDDEGRTPKMVAVGEALEVLKSFGD